MPPACNDDDDAAAAAGLLTGARELEGTKEGDLAPSHNPTLG